MHRVRMALRAIAVTWLLAQALTMSVAAVAVSLAGAQDDSVECSCTHGANAICPMHHRPASGSTVCAIGSIDHGVAALTSLLSITGLIPQSAHLGVLSFARPVFRLQSAAPSFATISPDPPPPRA